MNTVMDIRFFNTFIEVAKTRHFGRAAESLYLTQSAVSARIRLLEDYFNTQLFIRERHSIRLTQAGEKLLPFAESFVLTLNEAKKTVSAVDELQLTIGATPNASALFTSSLLSATYKRFNNISITSELLGTEQLIRQLLERSVDIGFSTDRPKSDDITAQQLGELTLRLYCKGERALEDSLQHYIHVNWNSSFDTEIVQLNSSFRHAKLKTPSFMIALDALKQAPKATIVLPEKFAEDISSEFELVAIDHYTIQSTLSLFISRLKSASRSAYDEYFQFYLNPINYGGLLEPAT